MENTEEFVEVPEEELSDHDYFEACFLCGELIGSIYLCGEGYICESCFAEAAGIPEEDAFFEENITREARDKAKETIYDQA